MGDISIKGRSPILRQGFATGGMAGGSEKGKPHSSKEGRIVSGKRKIIRALQSYSKPGTVSSMDKFARRHQDIKRPPDSPRVRHFGCGRAGLKKGGKSDKKWIQKATASIKRRGTKGKCTPITKKGCTGRAKALAKTFKKMAKKRKAA